MWISTLQLYSKTYWPALLRSMVELTCEGSRVILAYEVPLAPTRVLRPAASTSHTSAPNQNLAVFPSLVIGLTGATLERFQASINTCDCNTLGYTSMPYHTYHIILCCAIQYCPVLVSCAAPS
eukprot:1191938-Prorocentrum_minimum.AAC.1